MIALGLITTMNGSAVQVPLAGEYERGKHDHRFFANLLLGNTDGHAKNLSNLCSPKGPWF
jgi:hypothetical protein